MTASMFSQDTTHRGKFIIQSGELFWTMLSANNIGITRLVLIHTQYDVKIKQYCNPLDESIKYIKFHL